jgi:hypothetical protein
MKIDLKNINMKPYQVLTQESIEKIERAIIFLEVHNEFIPNDKAPEVIEDLKAILTDVKE